MVLLRSAQQTATQGGIPGISDAAPTPIVISRKKRKPAKPSLRIPPPNQPEVELYGYQKTIISKTYSLVSKGAKKILLMVGGGCGKTYISASMIRDATQRAKRNRKCLFIVDKTVLIEQTAKKLLSLNVPCATLQGSGKIYKDAPVIIASAQTIDARIKKGASFEDILGIVDGFVVIDEAHESGFREIVEKTANYYIDNYDATLIGLTASPFRSNNEEYLGQKFTHSVEGPTIPEVVAMGKLSPSRDYGVGAEIDFTQLDVGKDGEYNNNQVEQVLSGNDNYVVEQWIKLCTVDDSGNPRTPRPTVVFSPTVNAAKKMAEAFNRLGYTAEWQDGKTSDEDRLAQDERLKSGETIALCCCNTLTAGWDLPEVECVIYNKISKSIANFFQACWRGSRISPWSGKEDFIVIDVGRNLQRLGHPMEATDYYIGPPRKKNSSDAERSMEKECPECGEKALIFAQVCECGYEFGQDDDEGDSEVQQQLLEEDLVEIYSSQRRKEIRSLRSEKRRLYKNALNPANAISWFSKEYNYAPPREWHIGAIFSKSLGKINRERYRKFLIEIGETEGKEGDDLDFWVRHEIRLEFGTPAQVSKLFQGDWRATLGVLPEDSRSTAKAKYLTLMKAFHPDTASTGKDAIMSASEAVELAQKVNQAWKDAVLYYDCAE